jgi:threonylcarbamoyladenosine tRNA methylthiotransferase MtaB
MGRYRRRKSCRNIVCDMSERVEFHPLTVIAGASYQVSRAERTMDKTFSILTIGCKLNQFESECIRESLLRRNWCLQRMEDGAQFCIINSCTVTGRSDARCRNAVRRARRASPDTFIVVTGCYAETQPEKLSAMDEVDLVLGNGAKQDVPCILDAIAAGGHSGMFATADTPFHAPADETAIECFHGHSRAFVKVQEGCSASCSYCIVPRARGPSRSVPPHRIRHQLQVLQNHGYHEIVLTGIHIGRYGADLTPPLTLATLVESIIDGTRDLRVRLSSIEPTEVTPRLLEIIASSDRIAPHLHIPLQSGDDVILEEMNRLYRARQFREVIEALSRARPDLALGTDVIVGFPGETEERFERTVALVRELPISYVHVFSFSPRPGTPAAVMAGRVSPEAKKRRSSRLIALSASKKHSFLKSQVGTVQLGLIEDLERAASSFARCLTGTYCDVFVPRRNGVAGTLAHVRITHMARGNLYGVLVDGPAPCLVAGEPGV